MGKLPGRGRGLTDDVARSLIWAQDTCFIKVDVFVAEDIAVDAVADFGCYAQQWGLGGVGGQAVRYELVDGDRYCM